MAKVMISLPDELLARIDGEAARRGMSRSAVLREYASHALDERDAKLAAEMRRLLAQPAGHHGGTGLGHLKAGRDAR